MTLRRSWCVPTLRAGAGRQRQLWIFRRLALTANEFQHRLSDQPSRRYVAAGGQRAQLRVISGVKTDGKTSLLAVSSGAGH